MSAAENPGKALASALALRTQAEAAVARNQWKRALAACERIAGLARLHGDERLLAAVLSQTALALMPLTNAQPQRVRRLLETMDLAVEAHRHDIDLAHAMHDALAMLAAWLAREEAGLAERRKRALARLGLTYMRPLCARFPAETTFADTLTRLEAATH